MMRTRETGRRRRWVLGGAACAAVLAGAFAWVWAGVGSRGELQVRYGLHGLEQVAYRGQTLVDVQDGADEQFRIWHMAASDLNGNPMTGGAYGWGENTAGRSWDVASRTWTYRFPWGRIRMQYVQAGDNLNVKITEENRVGSGVIFKGATLYPLVVHFPEAPVGFAAGAPRLLDNVEEPGVTAAEFGSGTVAVVVPDDGKVLYTGFETQRLGDGTAVKNAFAVTVSSVVPDSMKGAPAQRPGLLPGATDTFTVSIRFARAGTAAAELASDAYRSFAAHWPMRLNWPDRRVIGTVYLASSPAAETEADERDPRRYFMGTGEPIDIRGGDGLRRFQARVLTQARMATENLRRMDAQAVITWDLEGEEFPQSTSYVCAPDQIAQVAPEMESVVDASLPFAGMKLDDAYFKMLRDAGFRVGVCVRPQRFTLDANGKARQVTVTSDEALAELIRKMRYAHDRWGATVFYLDSTVGADGRALESEVLERAAAAVPDSLVIPEESGMRAYRGTAPFLSFLFRGETSIPAWVRTVYPHAFSANLVNDADAGKVAGSREELTDAVRRGDVLMVHADSWQANNGTVLSIYQDAKDGKP